MAKSANKVDSFLLSKIYVFVNEFRILFHFPTKQKLRAGDVFVITSSQKASSRDYQYNDLFRRRCC